MHLSLLHDRCDEGIPTTGVVVGEQKVQQTFQSWAPSMGAGTMAVNANGHADSRITTLTQIPMKTGTHTQSASKGGETLVGLAKRSVNRGF